MYGFWCVQIIHKQKTKLQRRQKVTEKVFFVCWKMSIKNTRHYFELTCREAGNVSWINNSQATWRRQCQKKRKRWMKPRKPTVTQKGHVKKKQRQDRFLWMFFLPKHTGVKKQEALRQLKSRIGGLESPQTLFCSSFVKPWSSLKASKHLLECLLPADGSSPIHNNSGDKLTSSHTKSPLITFKLLHF